MLIKLDKPSSRTTSYRPISLLSSIMKLLERVIEQCLWKHLEDIGFFIKYQSGPRKFMSTNGYLFCLSQVIMESFSRSEHVIAAFLDVEKAVRNVWHSGLRYKIYHLYLATNLCRWLSDFLVVRSYRSGFLVSKSVSQSRCSTMFKPESIIFPYYVNDMPNQCQIQVTTRPR